MNYKPFSTIYSEDPRRLLTENPVIVIKEGKIVKKSLLLSRLDLNSLTTMLREQRVFSIADVDYAIFGMCKIVLKG